MEVEEFLNWYSQKYILIRGPKAIEILYNGDFYFFFLNNNNNNNDIVYYVCTMSN
jgi:hypothetical protein